MIDRLTWIKLHAPAARMATAGSGIFPETLLAQAIIESSGKGPDGNYYVGASKLASQANNYFGIKAAKSYTGKKIDLPTLEYYGGRPVTVVQTFRAYNSVGDSFRDFVKFLQENPRYTKAGVFKASDAKQQAERIAAAGYATDPQYSTKLKAVIDSVKKMLPPPGVALSFTALAAAAAVFFLIYKKQKR